MVEIVITFSINKFKAKHNACVAYVIFDNTRQQADKMLRKFGSRQQVTE